MLKRSLLVCGIALCIGTLARAEQAADAEILWNAQKVPAWILPKTDGELLLPRTEAEPFAQALAAVTAYSAQFRIGPDDSFSLITIADGQDIDGIAYPPEEEDEEQDPIAPPAPKSANGKTTTVWLQQTHQGLDVSGGQIAVAMNEQGVLSIQGTFYPDIALKAIDALPADLLAKQAAASLTQELGYAPELTWLDAKAQIRVDETGIAHHVRLANVEYPGSQGYENDNLMVDTTDGSIVARLPNIHRAIKTVNDWHQPGNRTAARCIASDADFASGPTQFFSEPWFDFLNFAWWGVIDPTNHIFKAWEHSAITEQFYLRNFNQRSYDNRDSPIISNVRFSLRQNGMCITNNAFWARASNPAAPNALERKMYYNPSAPLPAPIGLLTGETALDQNIGAHELTHGLTELSSNLEYQNEAGAMNEASSDIMAESIEWWNKVGYGFKRGGVDWQTATDTQTPGANRNMLVFRAGRDDALRYFYNPELDRFLISRNPDGTLYERGPATWSQTTYARRNGGATCIPSEANDRCHVHSNSGILNHFFFLLSRGGQNPSNAQDTRIGVSSYTYGIGIAKAMKIWYGATLGAGPNRVGPRATFRDLRNATIRESRRLYAYAPGVTTLCDPQTLAVLDAWNKTGWADSPNSSQDLLNVCGSQSNLVQNGTMENEVTWMGANATVANWVATPDSRLAPPTRGAWAEFNINPRATDEMMSAFLGGSGRPSSNSISTTVMFPATISDARLTFSTDSARIRVGGRLLPLATDAGDYLNVSIRLGSTGAVVFSSNNIPSTNLRSSGIWSFGLNAAQRAMLRGQSAEIRFTYTENGSVPTKAVVDAVSLVVAP